MSEQEDGLLDKEAGRQTVVRLGFTLILLGYLMVWLPHSIAGLSFIGLEVGEWVKFLPQVRLGEIAADRNLFYLPPITLGLMLALWTTGWPNRRWQSWVVRGMAVMVAFLAFPAIEAVLDEGVDQWLARVLLIGLVVLVAALIPLLDRLPGRSGANFALIATISLAVIGLALPTWAYLAVRPAVAQLFDQQVGTGPGLWLNGIGHLLVAVATLWLLSERRRLRPAPAG